MASIINTTYPQYGLGGDFGDAMYKATLQGYQDRSAQYGAETAGMNSSYERLYNRQADWGQAEGITARNAYLQAGDSLQQSLASRGLSNSSAYGAASQGNTANYVNTLANISGQRLQNQNQIAGNELQYLGQAQQGAAALRGDQLGWMGGVQSASQAQNFQGVMQQEQFGQQNRAAKDQFNYQSQAAQQGFGNQYALAQQNYNNQRSLQNEFGFYSDGGPVPGQGSGDKVPAMLEPREFVLSNDMIAALESGRLDNSGLVNMIRQGRMQAGQQPVQGYAYGGAVHSPYNMARMQEQAQQKAAMMRARGYPG